MTVGSSRSQSNFTDQYAVGKILESLLCSDSPGEDYRQVLTLRYEDVV